jgi:hypothetical protein
LWVSLGSLVKFIIVLLWSGTWYPFSSFPTISFIKLFCFVFEECNFLPSFSPHCSSCCCATMSLIG